MLKWLKVGKEPRKEMLREKLEGNNMDHETEINHWLF